MKYSIIIPAHNEGENINDYVVRFLEKLINNLKDVDCEVIIVENGSSDDTFVVAMRLKEKYPELIKVFSNDRGSYGEAIKRGMVESRGDYLSVLECDFLDINFVLSSIDLFRKEKASFIVASKRHPDSIDQRPVKRRILTQVFNYIIHVTFGYPGSDTHGLKSIESNLAKQLCEMAVTTDEIFQTEIVMLAWRNGIEILELPICIEEVRSAPVSVRRRFPMILDLIQQLRRSLNRFSATDKAVPPRTVFLSKSSIKGCGNK